MFGKAIAQLIGTIECAGRIICSWCGKDMGASGTDMDTHTICGDCAKKM